MNRRFRLLIVEDETSIREPLLIYLERLGYLVQEAENGIEALDKVRSTEFDLILLDLKMPYMDGSQFGRSLQAADIRTPVLVMTAANTPEKIYNEVGRVIKAFDFVTVAGMIENILQHHS